MSKARPLFTKNYSRIICLLVLFSFTLHSQDNTLQKAEEDTNVPSSNDSSTKTLDQYTLDELLESQLILLEIYNPDQEIADENPIQGTDEFIFDALAEISYKIASIFFEIYTHSQDFDDILKAIPHIELATEIRPNNFAYQLFKGNLYYLIKRLDSYYIDAMIAYEMSGELIFESKQSFLALVVLYLQERMTNEANDLFLKMVTIDPDWVFSNAFDLFLTAFLYSTDRQVKLTVLDDLEKKYSIQFPQIYLTQAIVYASLDDFDSLEKAFNKYQAAKTFNEVSGMEEKEEALIAIINDRKLSNG